MKYLNDIKDIGRLDKFTVMVDDEDYNRLVTFTWTDHNGQIMRKDGKGEDRKNIALANEVMRRYDCMFDHKDRNALNNQKYNLREATYSQNQMNRDKISKPTASQYKGVSYDKAKKLWRARITVNGQRLTLGFFDLEEQAAKVYDINAKHHYGEFACLNFK